MTQLADMVHVDRAIIRYVRELTEASRDVPDVRIGLSTRGSLAWIRAAKAWALAEGRGHVVPEDVATLAHPVLGHRLLMAHGAAFGGVDPGRGHRRPARPGPRSTRPSVSPRPAPAARGAVARLRTMAVAPLRMLTPLGRSVLMTGLAVTVLALWFNWQEFVQLGVVAFGLLLVGLLWQALPGAPTADAGAPAEPDGGGRYDAHRHAPGEVRGHAHAVSQAHAPGGAPRGRPAAPVPVAVRAPHGDGAAAGDAARRAHRRTRGLREDRSRGPGQPAVHVGDGRRAASSPLASPSCRSSPEDSPTTSTGRRASSCR